MSEIRKGIIITTPLDLRFFYRPLSVLYKGKIYACFGIVDGDKVRIFDTFEEGEIVVNANEVQRISVSTGYGSYYHFSLLCLERIVKDGMIGQEVNYTIVSDRIRYVGNDNLSIDVAKLYNHSINENGYTSKLIPKGIYCHGCPYFSYLKMGDEEGEISIPYCLYLQQGSLQNGWKNNEVERLERLLDKTFDELIDHDKGLLGLDLLWDGCKECGVNDEEDEENLI